MRKGRLKLEPITNKSERNQTFKKRKRGIFKKVNELSTLCGVKACAIINSCDKKEPEFWPSREGAVAVHSEFMKVKETKRVSKMYDQRRYLGERIQKEEDKLMKLNKENRETELREVMFDLLKGKMMSPHHSYDESFIGELTLFIDSYVTKLTQRTEFLEANGATDVGDVNHVVVASDQVQVSDGTEVYDHMRQYDGMNVSVNEQAPGGSNDHVHHQTQPRYYGSNQGMNMSHQEPLQYQTPPTFYDQNQNPSQGMYTSLSHDWGQSSNQYPNQHQSFTSMLMGQPQQMSDVQDLASVASMDDNNNRYHQLPITSQMPSTTTNAAAELFGHSINNNRWPTRFGLD